MDTTTTSEYFSPIQLARIKQFLTQYVIAKQMQRDGLLLSDDFIGVMLDTLIVRSLLVPALSYDVGRRIWWPSRLGR